MEEEPRDRQAHPDDKAEQAQHVDRPPAGAMPASQSLRKFETTPMVKNVITKKMPRKMLASATPALIFGTRAGQRAARWIMTPAKVAR